MVRKIVLLLLLPMSLPLFSQNGDWYDSAKKYQDSLNAVFGDANRTILLKKDYAIFEGLDFYPIDLDFRVEARFIRTPNEEPFLMATTTTRKPLYVKYGEAYFTLKGVECKLNIYKSMTSFEGGPYLKKVFVPFTDFTTGDGTYGGGRYAYIDIPTGDTMVIDFNQVFNPYCAYNSGYSCPIVPRENDLQLRIEAGVKDFKK